MKITPDNRHLIYNILLTLRYEKYIAEKNHDKIKADDLNHIHLVMFDTMCKLYPKYFPDIEDIDYKAWCVIEDLMEGDR